MASEAHRQERRQLKQKLFTIRRHVEGEDVVLTDELKKLKEKYEKLEGFTSWSDFPEKWDIGDPNEVKRGYPAFDDIEKRNFARAFGKPYEYIVNKELPVKNEGDN